MNFSKMLFATALMILTVMPQVLAMTDDYVSKEGKKIVSAEETLTIELSKNLTDYSPKEIVHADGSYMIKLYGKNSLTWDKLLNCRKIDGGVFKDPESLRFVIDEPGVTVALERLKYWPGVEWYQPIQTMFEIEADENMPYEVSVPFGEKIPTYRLLIRKGEKLNRIMLLKSLLDKEGERELSSGDNIVYSVNEFEPMSHLMRVYAYWTAKKNEDVRYIRNLYWRTIATAYSLVMGEATPLDDDGYYHSTEWFFDEFAYALFPGVQWPDLRIEDHVLWFAERPEPYVIRRRTFDINYVNFVRQRREGDQLVVTMAVKLDKDVKNVALYLTPSSRYVHPFAWKIDKGVVVK